MPRFNPIQLAAASVCGASLTAGAPQALADVTLTSSDGRWTAIIETDGGATGQCNGMSDTSQPAAYRSFLVNTRHYVRIGTAISYGAAVSQPMQNHFHPLSFANSNDSYTAVLASNNVPGLIAIIHGEMVAGASGGLRVCLTFADTAPSDLILAQYSVKPFVYANLNVDGQMLGNTGSWSSDHYTQAAPPTGTGNDRWFRGRDPVAHQSMLNSSMQDSLDSGMAELANISNTGPGDINTAMSFAVGSLGPGDAHTVAYALGNENISIPAGFGLVPNAGAVSIASSDGRWSAAVNTGNAYLDHGSAGEITSMYDFSMPVDTSRFATLVTHYLAISTQLPVDGQKVKDTFERIAFFYPTDTTSMTSTVLNSKDWPGLVLIMDSRMYAGSNGGLVTCMKFADTLGRTLNIAPVVFADMDCDNQTVDTGEFLADHFIQKGPGFSPYRGFRAASYSSYQSGLSGALQSTLDSGVVALANTTVPGPINISTALAPHPWPLIDDQPYVTGFALGAPNLQIPPAFVRPSVWYTCPADVAPAPDGDSMIDVNDLLSVITSWGACPLGTPGDIVPTYVGNGTVDVNDLLEVIMHWGPCWSKTPE